MICRKHNCPLVPKPWELPFAYRLVAQALVCLACVAEAKAKVREVMRTNAAGRRGLSRRGAA